MTYTRMFDGGLAGWLTIDYGCSEFERLDELTALVKQRFDCKLISVLKHADNPGVYVDIEVEGQGLSLHSVTGFGVSVLAKGNEEAARRVADCVTCAGEGVVVRGGGSRSSRCSSI